MWSLEGGSGMLSLSFAAWDGCLCLHVDNISLPSYPPWAVPSLFLWMYSFQRVQVPPGPGPHFHRPSLDHFFEQTTTKLIFFSKCNSSVEQSARICFSHISFKCQLLASTLASISNSTIVISHNCLLHSYICVSFAFLCVALLCFVF